MKSPLVDALRQATEARSLENTGDALVVDDIQQDTLQTANEGYPEQDTGPESESGSEAGQDLELLEATGALIVSEIDETDEATEDEDETMLVAALPEDAVLADDRHSITQQLYRTTHADERPARLPEAAQRHSAVSRVGRWSPVLCILLAAIAAGAWWALQSIGGFYTNSDLQNLSDQALDSTEELADFGVGGSPFPLIVSAESAAAQTGSDEQ